MQTPEPRRRRRRPRPWAALSALVCLAPPAVANHISSASDVLATVSAPSEDRGLEAGPLDGVNMTLILETIGRVECASDVDATVTKFMDVNKLMVDACSKDSGFQLSTVATALPEAEQTKRICNSPNCMDLFTGIILAKLPECELSRYSPRSLAESMVRVRVDLQNKREAPTAKQLLELYTTNRVINYLIDSPDIQTRVNPPFNATEVSLLMNPLSINHDIVITKDMAVYRTESKGSSAGSSAPTTATPTATTSSPISKSNSTTPISVDVEGVDGSGFVLPENLKWAYLVVGLFWLAANALYHFMMARKGIDE